MRNVLNNYDRFFYKIIACSAGAHFLFVFLLLYGKFLPSRTINYNPSYTVRLVSTASAPGKERAAAGTRTVRQAAPQHLHEPTPRMILPIEKKAPGKKALLSALRNVSREIKQQELMRAIQGASRSSSGPAKGSTPSAGAAAGTGLPSGTAAKEYYALLWQKIQNAWIIPSNMADASYGYETVVSITIHKDGAVTGISVEKSSGNIYFDQTAIRAIKRAAPLPPFPPSWLQQRIDIGLKFSCKEGCK